MGLEARHAYRFGYLQSEHWATLRARKLAAVDGRCICCAKQDPGNDVHHIHYGQDLLKTKLKHLAVLCREHHDMIHQFSDKIRAEWGCVGHSERLDSRVFIVAHSKTIEYMAMNGQAQEAQQAKKYNKRTSAKGLQRVSISDDPSDYHRLKLRSIKSRAQTFLNYLDDIQYETRFMAWIAPSERSAIEKCKLNVKDFLTSMDEYD